MCPNGNAIWKNLTVLVYQAILCDVILVYVDMLMNIKEYQEEELQHLKHKTQHEEFAGSQKQP